jgi:hypothetical protein
MKDIMVFKRKQPWRDALIATTGLSLFVLAATLLWQTGYRQWAFVSIFVAVWMLLSISWSNLDFTEKSGTLLAEITDHNFQVLYERVEKLEKTLEDIGVSSLDD